MPVTRAVRIAAFGEPAEVVTTGEVPTPEAGPGEVVVRMRVRPVNPSDLSLMRGRYGQLPPLPATPGLEGMGVVESVGPGAEGVALGARVVPVGVMGTWSERVVAPAAQLVPVPDGVGDEAAAQLVVNPLTAWIMLTEELDVRPGEWLLQDAAGSTLGRVVLQLARLRGFRTINVVRRAEQAEELRALGADEVVVSEGEGLVERVQQITGGAGVTTAMDAVGGVLGARMADCLAPGGTLLVYGLLSREPLPLDGRRLIFGGTTVRGFWLTQWMTQNPPQRVAEAMGTMMRMMAEGTIAPPVEARYDLAEARAAVAHAKRPGRSGKVLMVG
jgi:NADPH:quinone reductase